MIVPSALNVLTIGASVIVFLFLWRLVAARFADSSVGEAMGAIFA